MATDPSVAFNPRLRTLHRLKPTPPSKPERPWARPPPGIRPCAAREAGREAEASTPRRPRPPERGGLGAAPAERSKTDSPPPPKAGEANGADRDRTDDLLHAMQALSQLSYGPSRVGREILGTFRPLGLVVSAITRGPRRIPGPSTLGKEIENARLGGVPAASVWPVGSGMDQSDSPAGQAAPATSLGPVTSTCRAKNSRIRARRSILRTGSPDRLRS